MAEESSRLELLQSLLYHAQPSHIMPNSALNSPQSITSEDMPWNVFHPLFPQVLHQQLLNLNLAQLFTSMISHPTMLSSSTLSAIETSTEDVPSTSASKSEPSREELSTAWSSFSKSSQGLPSPHVSVIDSVSTLPSSATSSWNPAELSPWSVLAGSSLQEGSLDKNTLVVPSHEREGWCRNKKYIEKITGGFMCLVCRKVYGRYNSVSYHVTIYHRNPPIKCDLEGCEFTTREARYIHFHKYYRHGIGLPRSIDQGSRRCMFCKHISKSPAMLEKHMKRHVDTKKEGIGRFLNQRKWS